MAIAERVDVEECECLVALKELHRRDFSCVYTSIETPVQKSSQTITLDDFAEDTSGSHSVTGDNVVRRTVYVDMCIRMLDRTKGRRGVAGGAG